MLPAADAAGGTAHLKQIPEPLALREQIRSAVEARVAALDRSLPLVRHRMESHAREVLEQLHLPHVRTARGKGISESAVTRGHVVRNSLTALVTFFGLEIGALLGGTVVVDRASLRGLRRLQPEPLASAGPQKRLPGPDRRRLPDRAATDPSGPSRRRPGNRLPQFAREGARQAPDHRAAGHGGAAPLVLAANTSTDQEWALEMIDTPYRPGAAAARSQVHLLRAASRMFEAEELSRLLPAQRGNETLRALANQPLEAMGALESTEILAHDFLTRGGKYYRPFITLAAYDALRGGHGWGHDEARAAQLPEAVAGRRGDGTVPQGFARPRRHRGRRRLPLRPPHDPPAAWRPGRRQRGRLPDRPGLPARRGPAAAVFPPMPWPTSWRARQAHMRLCQAAGSGTCLAV